jgi:hypothetical protein
MSHESVNEETAHRYGCADKHQANRPFSNAPKCSQTKYVKLNKNAATIIW